MDQPFAESIARLGMALSILAASGASSSAQPVQSEAASDDRTVAAINTASRCQPADCLRRIAARVAVELVAPEETAIVGVWSRGDGLSGSNLYLFGERSYIYTEWADIQPETIHDKGLWTAERGALTLVPDSDVTWVRPFSRRYLTLGSPRLAGTLLFGIDMEIELFERLVGDEPAEAMTWLRLSSLRRRHGWAVGESLRVKADLMERSWRPEYFKP
jgi:hypothetical protein